MCNHSLHLTFRLRDLHVQISSSSHLNSTGSGTSYSIAEVSKTYFFLRFVDELSFSISDSFLLERQPSTNRIPTFVLLLPVNINCIVFILVFVTSSNLAVLYSVFSV